VIDRPEIVEATPALAAVIHLTIPRSEIGAVMGPAMAELMGAIAKQGIAATGPMFSHHLRMDPKTFDFEVGVPVAAAVQPDGRVQAGSASAATKIARTVYHGGYEGLGGGWGEFDQWQRASGHTFAPDLWERYLTGPESGPDQSKWQTELSRPLASFAS
jgi:effector-binding domain-containing protein